MTHFSLSNFGAARPGFTSEVDMGLVAPFDFGAPKNDVIVPLGLGLFVSEIGGADKWFASRFRLIGLDMVKQLLLGKLGCVELNGRQSAGPEE